MEVLLVPVVVYGPNGGYSSEVTAVNGMLTVTPHASSSVINAETSKIDLADLSIYRPRWKYAFSSRAGVNSGVTLHFP